MISPELAMLRGKVEALGLTETKGLVGAIEAAAAMVMNFEHRFLTFVDSVPDAMLLSDAEGMIVLVSTNTEKLFGHSREESGGPNSCSISCSPPQASIRLVTPTSV